MAIGGPAPPAHGAEVAAVKVGTLGLISDAGSARAHQGEGIDRG